MYKWTYYLSSESGIILVFKFLTVELLGQSGIIRAKDRNSVVMKCSLSILIEITINLHLFTVSL